MTTFEDSLTETGKPELDFLGAADTDTVAALVMDLAAQLHIERQRRMALETALVRAGLIDRAAIEGLAEDAGFLAEARAALDTSVRRSLRIMTEAGDHTGPLRAEAPAVEPTAP